MAQEMMLMTSTTKTITTATTMPEIAPVDKEYDLVGLTVCGNVHVVELTIIADTSRHSLAKLSSTISCNFSSS